MIKQLIFCFFIYNVNAQLRGLPRSGRAENGFSEEQNFPPQPYEFEYSADTPDGGRMERKESGDENGVVTGFYTIIHGNGYQRRVDYIADIDGYRASVSTNEIGTESQSPSNVRFESSAPTAKELSIEHTAQLERDAAAQGGRRIVADEPVIRPGVILTGQRQPPRRIARRKRSIIYGL